MRFETVNKVVKRTVKNGNKLGIARIAMEKLNRSIAKKADEKRQRPVDDHTQTLIQTLYCDPRGKNLYCCMRYRAARSLSPSV